LHEQIGQERLGQVRVFDLPASEAAWIASEWRYSRSELPPKFGHQFGSANGDLDAEMVAIAGAVIRQRTGDLDPSTFRDHYQQALQLLIEAKMKGLAIKPPAVSTPPPVIDLMAALKRSVGGSSDQATDCCEWREMQQKID
jgi:non-homologous end joining protein Ku